MHNSDFKWEGEKSRHFSRNLGIPKIYKTREGGIKLPTFTIAKLNGDMIRNHITEKVDIFIGILGLFTCAVRYFK